MGGRTTDYTEAEDSFLRKHYSRRSANYIHTDIIARMFHRPAGSIIGRAQRLGLQKPRSGSRLCTRVETNVRATVGLPVGIPETVSPALAALAAFDPVLARVVNEKTLGLEPGYLADYRKRYYTSV